MARYDYELYGTRQASMKKYVLQKDAVGLKKGTIFVHDKEDNIVGSHADGCLKLAWTDSGGCQEGAQYCGGTFILHSSVKDDPEWFKEDISIKDSIKRQLIELIEKL
jgi:hypothetical protein